MHELEYVPGSGVLIAGPSSFVIADAVWHRDHLMRVWDAVDAQGSLSDVLDAVTGGSVGDLATFVVCVFDAESGNARIIQRPGAAVTIHGVDGVDTTTDDLDAVGVALWAEHQVAAGAGLEVTLPAGPVEAEASRFPFHHGITRAGSLRWRASSLPRQAQAADAVVVTPSEAPASPASPIASRVEAPNDSPDESSVESGRHRQVVEDTPSEPPGAVDLSQASLSIATTGEATPTSDPEESGGLTLAEPFTLSARDHQPATTDLEQPSPGGQVADADPYDSLFGATVFRSVADAAVRPDAEAPRPLGQDAGHDHVATVQPSPPEAAPTDADVPAPLVAASTLVTERFNEDQPEHDPVSPPAPAPTGMIESVPSSVQATSPVVPQVDADGDHDGLTITASSLRALRAQERAGTETAVPHASVPLVHAITCALGHPNPPQSAACRVCGQALAFQDPVTVPRPPLGVLVFAGGREVTLDRVVLVGRGPTVERVAPGDLPHLVKLDSPTKDLSRNHVEIRLEGWHVLVVDLQSTNGTVVQMPGRQPERVHPNEPYAIVPGTVVTIGDEQSFVYEVRG